MATLTKADIAEQLYLDLKSKLPVRISRKDTKQLTEVFIEEIMKELVAGNHVKLSRFGNFILRDKSSRPGRNPKTGESIEVSARRVVTFRSGQKLKARIKQSAVLQEKLEEE
ncbi:MAG: integration host factor subunit alpha [Legionellales bacterium]|nr:integration host factor subunit alpha [Legionellales bacterium]